KGRASKERDHACPSHRCRWGTKSGAGWDFQHVARPQLFQRDADTLSDLWTGRQRRWWDFPNADRDADHRLKALRYDRAGPMQSGTEIRSGTMIRRGECP